MKHPDTGATIVSVKELRDLLDSHAFKHDSPLGIVMVTETGRILDGEPLRFPCRISVAKGTGVPDMLVISVPAAPPSPVRH